VLADEDLRARREGRRCRVREGIARDPLQQEHPLLRAGRPEAAARLGRPVDGTAHDTVDRRDRSARQVGRSLVDGLSAADLPPRHAAAADKRDGGRLDDPGREGRKGVQ